MFVQRLGADRPLLLLHGIGGSWRSWTPLSRRLALRRALVLPDLPGFGDSPPEGLPSFQRMADVLAGWLAREGLVGVEAVGHSLGGQLVLELARRGLLGCAVALCPGGYWVGWERAHVASLLLASAQMARALLPALPALAGTAAGRMLMAAQLSARPWALEPDVLLSESLTLASSRWLEPLAAEMLVSPQQPGTATLRAPLLVLYAAQDRVCFPHQRARAEAAFPGARFDTLRKAGHYAHWDEAEAVLTRLEAFFADAAFTQLSLPRRAASG